MVDKEGTEKFKLSSRYTELSNVWEDYSTIQKEYNSISLGQGCPDFLPPQYLLDALVRVAKCTDSHQYTRTHGHPRLVNILSQLYTSLMNHLIDPYSDIVITSGAYAALNSSILSHIEKGDEVLIIEPSFDCYSIMVEAAGGTVKYIPLRLRQNDDVVSSKDWVLDHEELQNAFNHKTKAIILNTPHNPFGKIFSEAELTEIGELCKKWNVLCIADEVYEWLVYEPQRHIRIASLPGMWERTITIGSAGKTFCITGWKLGWAIGPEHLIKNVQLEHSFQPGTIQQEAVAIAFETEMERFDKPECHFKSLAKELELKRDRLVRTLTEIGMKVIVPEAGIFVVADWTPLKSIADISSEVDCYEDFRFTKWFAKHVGVVAIPMSVFYSDSNKKIGESFARFCFIKKDEKLSKAEELMKSWISKNSPCSKSK